MDDIQMSKYDLVSNVAAINMFSFGKETKRIELPNYNYKNLAHVALFNIAAGTAPLFHYNIYIGTNIFTFIKLKLTNKKYKKIKFLWGKKNLEMPSCNEFIDGMERSNNALGILEKFQKEVMI